MRRFKAGQQHPTLLVAEQQSAGRGRLGRQWHGQRGDALTFSFGLSFSPSDWSGLSLAVGVGLAESLDVMIPLKPSLPQIALKWPNDLWRVKNNRESKLAGILVETAAINGQRYAVIGIGINVRSIGPVYSAGFATPPAYLQDSHPDADVANTLARVVPPLVAAVLAFERFGFAPFQSRFAQRDVLAGREVRLSNGAHGRACGVTHAGALLVHTLAGMQEITSSEVSVRPC